MWACYGTTLAMTEGDFGVELPVIITGPTFTASDELRIKIVGTDGTTIIEKTYDNITNNRFSLEFTASESALLPIGKYNYSLDWYQNSVFMCNIIPSGKLEVSDKI